MRPQNTQCNEVKTQCDLEQIQFKCLQIYQFWIPTFTRVLQGQEARTLGSGDSDAEITHSTMMCGSKLEDFTADGLEAVQAL
ncbi:hypothetical protein SUGI_1178020 [Cryptomeria japonica]|nr:hypothetical protein SUGI_1178020 [Cryptomeria japonica]